MAKWGQTPSNWHLCWGFENHLVVCLFGFLDVLVGYQGCPTTQGIGEKPGPIVCRRRHPDTKKGNGGGGRKLLEARTANSHCKTPCSNRKSPKDSRTEEDKARAEEQTKTPREKQQKLPPTKQL